MCRNNEGRQRVAARAIGRKRDVSRVKTLLYVWCKTRHVYVQQQRGTAARDSKSDS